MSGWSKLSIGLLDRSSDEGYPCREIQVSDSQRIPRWVVRQPSPAGVPREGHDEVLPKR
jgi:hypothetical protein